MDKISIRSQVKWSGFLFALSFLFFISCDSTKNDVIFEQDEQSAYEAEEVTEHLFDVVESITNSAIQYYGTNSGGRLAQNSDPELSCATVAFSGDVQSGRLEINFGDGCIGPDGKTRKGVIVVEYTGHWAIKDSEIFTVLQDFYIDDIKVEGTRILTNVSLDATALVYTEEIINGKIIWPDETYLTRMSDRTHTLIFGQANDIFELQVEGTASGTTRLGVTYETETIEPLVFKTSCRLNSIYLPVAGIKTITIPEKPAITVNYGNGDCDTKFTVTIDNESKEVIL